jgi:hypothetical protein
MAIPKSQIFFHNFSSVTLDIIDHDGTLWGFIEPGATNNNTAYSIALPYSSNSNRQYTLIIPGTPNTIAFSLDRNGSLINVAPTNGQVSLEPTILGQFGITVNIVSINLLSILPVPLPPKPYVGYLPPNFSWAVLYYNDY